MVQIDIRAARGRRAVIAGGALSLLAIAACSSESTAPAPQSPTKPSATMLSLGTWVTVRFVDQNGDPAANMGIQITPYRGLPHSFMDSEIFGDTDPRVGYLKVLLPMAPSYTSCLPLASGGWVWEGNGCRTVMATGGTVDMGVYTVYRKPELTFYMQDRDGHIIEGGSIRITGPNGFDKTAMDAASGGSLNGIVAQKLDTIGTYSWCETVPPDGYALAQTPCGTVTVWWGQKPVIQLKHDGAIIPTYPF